MTKIVVVSLFVLAFVLAACASAPHFDLSRPARDLYSDYLQAFNVSFRSPKEKLTKFTVFQNNLKKIAELNAAAKAAGHNTEFGLNAFSLHTEAEFNAMYLGKVMPNIPGLRPAVPATPEQIAALPTSFDWRSANPPVITDIKNQGQCGDCWAFSTTGNVEGVWARANHPLVSLSEQQLTDCSKANDGCNGGEMSTAFEYIIKTGGIESEDDYPFKGTQGKCKFDPSKVAAKISSWVSVQKQVDQMQAYLVANAPISIAVDATSWQYYNKGILHSNCGTSLDHGVLLVGYGVDSAKNMPYWIIKNSWGKSWGMSGYIEVEITGDLCGIQKQPVSSVA